MTKFSSLRMSLLLRVPRNSIELEDLGSDVPLNTSFPSLNIKLSSVSQTTINAINLLMGMGLLSIPYSLSLLGWTLGIFLLISFAAGRLVEI